MANQQLEIFDFDSTNLKMTSRQREEIETYLAIENESARSAGKMGFMARGLIQASMPYRDPKTRIYERRNGKVTLEIISAAGGGVPFGAYPRLLMSWITTEAFKTQSPVLELGESLSDFLSGVGLSRGYASKNFLMQMKRLLSSLVSIQREGQGGFILRNVLIADELKISKFDEKNVWHRPALEKAGTTQGMSENLLWLPQPLVNAGTWKSELTLSNGFFTEIIESPVPIDLRAFIQLKASALAMDIYSWLTYRFSYLKSTTNPIPWELLQLQFGSGFPNNVQGKRNFKKAFLRELKSVLNIYQTAKVESQENGLILHPSPPHVVKIK